MTQFVTATLRYSLELFFLLTVWIVVVRGMWPGRHSWPASWNALRVVVATTVLLLMLGLNVIFEPFEVVDAAVAGLAEVLRWFPPPAPLAAPLVEQVRAEFTNFLRNGHPTLTAQQNAQLAVTLAPLAILSAYCLLRGALTAAFHFACWGVMWMTRLLIGGRPDVASNKSERPSSPGFTAVVVRYELAYARSAIRHALPYVTTIGLAILFASLVSKHRISPALEWAQWSFDPFAGHQHGLWIASYILMAELLGFTLLFRDKGEAGSVWGVDMVSGGQRSLLPLFQKAVTTFEAHILYARPVAAPVKRAKATESEVGIGAPGAKPRYEQPPEDGRERTLQRIISKTADPAVWRIAQELQAHEMVEEGIASLATALEKFLDKKSADPVDKPRPRTLMLEDALHPIHLAIVFALAEQRQSQGLVTLVIVPHASLARIISALDAQKRASIAGKAQRSLVLDWEPVEKEAAYTYVVVSDRNLDRRLLGDEAGARHIIPSIGMIVALELDDLHVSELRFQLERLWLRLDRARVDTIVQAGNLANPEALARALFPGRSGEPAAEVEKVQVLEHLKLHQHYVIWRDGAALLSAATANSTGNVAVDNKILSSEVALHLLPAAMAFRSIGIGRGLHRDLDEYDRVVEKGKATPLNIEVKAEPTTVAMAMREANGPDAKVPLGLDQPLVLVSSTASLRRALGEWNELAVGRESLRFISCRDYPLRDYENAKLKSDKDPGTFLKSNRFMTPVPQGGIKELLVTLYHALSEDHIGREQQLPGLSRDQIRDLFLSRLPAELRKHDAVAPSRAGLEELFAAFGAPVSIALDAERDPDGIFRTRRYKIAATAARAGGLSFDLTVRQEDGFVPKLRISTAEIGLTVFPGQTILIEGRRCIVSSIGSSEVVVSTQAEAEPKNVLPAIQLRFETRDGRPWPGVDRAAAARPSEDWIAISENSIGNGWRSRRWIGYFSRTTTRVILHPPTSTLLGESTGRVVSKVDMPRVKRLYQSVFEIAAPAPSSENVDLAEVAFSLCVVLQDVLRAEFPRFGHRLHVVSPQSQELFTAARERDELDVFDDSLGAAQQADVLLLHRYPWLCDNATPAALATAPDDPTNVPRGIDLYVVEDSDTNLGIVHAIALNPRHVMELASQYLHWLVHKEDGRSTFHMQGGKEMPSILRYRETQQMLNSFFKPGAELPSTKDTPLVEPADSAA